MHKPVEKCQERYQGTPYKCMKHVNHAGFHVTKFGTYWTTAPCGAQHPRRRSLTCDAPLGHTGAHESGGRWRWSRG